MKTKLIIDFGHLSSRMLYTAIHLSKAKKKDGLYITDEYRSIFYHMVLNSIRFAKKTHKADEVIVCLDGFGSWRKGFYPEYKGNRDKSKSDINWEEYYTALDELVKAMNESFPYKIIGVKDAEADDIVAIITKEYHEYNNIVILSEDKDFIPLCKLPNVKQYMPIKKQYVTKTNEEIELWTLMHRCLGDAVDNIPNIKSRTKFSPAFISFLKENDIYTESVVEFNKMSIKDHLIDKYNVYKKITAGKLKGKLSDTKDIYKTVPFGEKGAIKFIKDLDVNLNNDPLLKENYEFNRTLTSFECIPEDIYNNVKNTYNELTIKYSQKGISDFLMKFHLGELMKNVSDFYGNVENNTTSLDDFF